MRGFVLDIYLQFEEDIGDLFDEPVAGRSGIMLDEWLQETLYPVVNLVPVLTVMQTSWNYLNRY